MSKLVQAKVWIKAAVWGPLLALACATSWGQNTGASPRAVDREHAEQAYAAGARLIERQDLAGAQADFERAAKLNPERRDYAMALTLTRDHRVSELVQLAAKSRMLGRPEKAEALLAEAKLLDPKNELVLQHDGEQQARVPGAQKAVIVPKDVVFAPLITIQPETALKDVHVRGDAKQALTQAAALFGVKVVIDGSLQVQVQPLRFDLEKASYGQVMPVLEKMSHSFGVAVNPKLLLVATDNPENRQRLERQVEETIFVPASTAEQLNELTNIVKNVFDVKQVAIGAASGTVLVRAPGPTIQAINETLEDLIDGPPEVMLEVKLLSVDKMRTVNTGLQTPASAGVFSVEGEAASIVSANQALVNELISSGGYVPTGNAGTDIILEALYLVLSGAVQDAKVSGLIALAGNGLGLTGIYLGSGATINLALNSSDAKALDDVTVRVDDKATATLRVGERYPITTATYSSGVSKATTSALAGLTINGQSATSLLNQYLGSAANSIPQIQYEDLGITLKATPTVLRSGLVDMKVDLKVESLAGGSSNGIPVLTSRSFVSDITLPDGSSGMMLSDLTRTEAASISGLPGLGELPGFDETTADRLRDVDTSELVLVLTPHVVRHRKDLMASRMIPFSTSVPQEF